MSSDGDPTRLLKRLAGGDAAAASDLLPLVYRELHATAERLMHGERAEHTLQATALIHEAFLKLVHDDAREWQGKAHFLRVAARAMRQVLVDHARARRADKRGGDRERITLHETALFTAASAEDVLDVDAVLCELRAQDERLAEVVEMRFFAGMTHDEIATALGVTTRTIERDWRLARAFLASGLAELSDDAR